MQLPKQILGLTVAAILLLIAVPYALVQLDILAAGYLRIIPSLIAVCVAAAFIAAFIASRRRKRGGQ